jgi:hypothetical protein
VRKAIRKALETVFSAADDVADEINKVWQRRPPT